MKRILTISLSAILILGLIGCSKDTVDNSQPQSYKEQYNAQDVTDILSDKDNNQEEIDNSQISGNELFGSGDESIENDNDTPEDIDVTDILVDKTPEDDEDSTDKTDTDEDILEVKPEESDDNTDSSSEENNLTEETEESEEAGAEEGVGNTSEKDEKDNTTPDDTQVDDSETPDEDEIEAPVDETEQEEPVEATGEIYYISGVKSAKTYHSDKMCMRLATARERIQISLSECLANQLSPCKSCIG